MLFKNCIKSLMFSSGSLEKHDRWITFDKYIILYEITLKFRYIYIYI